jgi:hypothetical protein
VGPYPPKESSRKHYFNASLEPGSDTRVPLVPLVFPKAAFAAADAAQTGNHIYTDDVFSVLIAELTLYTEPKRRAVLDR